MSQFAGRYDEVVWRRQSSAPNSVVQVLADAEVTVFESDGTTEATLYTDRTKDTTASNPVSPDADGNLEFFAEPGTYVLSIALDGVVLDTNTVIVPNDPEEVVGAIPDTSALTAGDVLQWDGSALVGSQTYVPLEDLAVEDAGGGKNIYLTHNTIDPSATTAVVLGGTSTDPNVVGAEALATIVGGYDHTISDGIASTIVGGGHHTSDASGGHTFIGGGSTHRVSGSYGVVAGGLTNVVESLYATIAGGREHLAGDAANRSTVHSQFIGGGYSHIASGHYSTVVGGFNHLASATHTTVGGGDSHIASGAYATVAGGSNNQASGPFSFIAGGLRAYTDGLYGAGAHAAGQFATKGDAQRMDLVARNSTTNGTQTELFLDGSSTRLTLNDDSTYAFRITVVARRTDADGESAGYTFEGVVDRNAGTTALVGSVTKTVLAEDAAAWDATVEADDTNDALVVKVTGEAAKTIRWVARIDLTKVAG